MPKTAEQFDRDHLWHPYAPMDGAPPVVLVEEASGIRLKLADGREVIDGIGSWWSVIHGYNHPVINRAMQTQMAKFSHVMFGGCTHRPAIELGQRLLRLLPEGLEKIFYADSGSIAAEVAIKMAIQYQFARGRTDKNRILTVKGGYHGDTLGTMALCDPDEGMHTLFRSVLAPHFFAPAPPMGFNREYRADDLAEMERLLQTEGRHIAAVMLEPILQGAGGMRIYAPEYLRQVHALARRYDVLVVFDEIATGFGRTGKLWAAEWAGVAPDIMCIGKALTGGHISLAATIATAAVATTISRGKPGAFMHGPTFMANALACAAANGALEVLEAADWQPKVKRMEAILHRELDPLAGAPNVAAVRVLGSLGVLEAPSPWNRERVQLTVLEHGVWARPFGNVLYLMAPYVATEAELLQMTRALAACATRPELVQNAAPGDDVA